MSFICFALWQQTVTCENKLTDINSLMIRLFLALGLIVFSLKAVSQISDTADLKPNRLPLWTVAVPGASYFYQNKILKGSIFATLEIGGIYLGIKYKDELKSKSSSPYYNFPMAIGQQAFQVEKLANFRNHLEQVKYRNPNFKYDDLSEKELYLAPFKRKNIFTPITGIFAVLAGVTLGANYYLGIQNNSPSLSGIGEMSLGDSYLPRNQALAIYCPLGAVQAWGAGVAEEYVFRNWLMPQLDYRYGKKKGLVLSSVAFGLSHFPNYFKANSRETRMAALSQLATTSLAGMVYGFDVQRRGYNIGPSVAAHAWFDMIVMVGSFLINPENNYLGVDLKMKL